MVPLLLAAILSAPLSGCAAGGGPPAAPPPAASSPAIPEAGSATPVASPPAASPAASPGTASPGTTPGAPLVVPPPADQRVQPIRTPRALYELCHDRVELPEAVGECKADADCAKAGCGGEVCTTVAAAADVMTTCEDADCFRVLDTCGCLAGACTWTVKLPGAAPTP